MILMQPYVSDILSAREGITVRGVRPWGGGAQGTAYLWVVTGGGGQGAAAMCQAASGWACMPIADNAAACGGCSPCLLWAIVLIIMQPDVNWTPSSIAEGGI